MGRFLNRVKDFVGTEDDTRIGSYGQYDATLGDGSNPDPDPDPNPDPDPGVVGASYKKADILKIVSEYMAKDTSIQGDLDKIIPRPAKSDEDIAFDFKALALKNKQILKETLGELIDKDKDVQKIVDELATPPKPVDPPKPADPPKPVDDTRLAPVPLFTAPLFPAAFNAEDYAEGVIKTLREYPEARAIVLNADTAPSPAEAYFDGWNDPKHKNELTVEQATKLASNDDRFRTLAKAIEAGYIHVEKRVADRNGKPTDRPFPEEEPKKGPSK